MAIVRELLIKLGFQTDKKAVNETNQAISGFKTRFAIAATAATYAFTKVAQFFADVATATLDANDLARTLGISLREFTALQAGFSSFRIDSKQVEGVFRGINKQLNDFITGADQRLAEVAQRLNFEVDRNGGPLKLFQQILLALSKISTETDRIRIAGNLFGEELSVRISDLSQNIDQFNQVVKQSDFLGQNAEKALPALQAYQKNIDELSQAWKNFGVALSETVVPALTSVLRVLTYILDFYRDLATVFKEGNFQPLTNTLKKASKDFDDSALGRFFNNGLRTIGNNINADLFEPDEIFDRTHFGNNFQPALAGPSVVNNIDVNVAPGTTEDQARFMSEQISQRVQDTISDSWRQIQNNTPMVE